MPVGACDGCRRYFVIAEADPLPHRCPRCGMPMRVGSCEETVAHLRRPHAPPPPKPPPEIAAADREGDEARLSQRARWARAAVVSQRAELRVKTRELRRLRQEMHELLQETQAMLRNAALPPRL